MSNAHFREKEMSLSAKGLLSLMLSLPDDWEYSISGLVSICKESATAIKATIKELKNFGYLAIRKKMPNETSSGRIEYEYDIFEQPQQKQEVEKQPLELQAVVLQEVENPLQLNTNNKILNNKVLNNKKKNIKKKTDSGYDDILKNIVDDSLRELYQEYIKMRKLIKAPMTERALQMLINKVNDLEPNSIERQKKLLETAIVNNWKSVYPLKNEPQTQGTVEEQSKKYQSTW